MAAIAVLALAVAALAVLVLALYRQVGVLALRIAPRHALELAEEGPELGADAPQLDRLTRDGEELVAFLGAGCRVCHELEPSLRALAREGLPVHLVYDVEDGAALERWERARDAVRGGRRSTAASPPRAPSTRSRRSRAWSPSARARMRHAAA